MPERNTAPGADPADSAAVARRIARWAAARPTLAAAPDPGPQQAWMAMRAIAQACGDPAIRLVAQTGQALLITNSRNTPAMTGWDALPQPGAAVPGATRRDIHHRLELAEAMADTLDALAVHPTLMRDDRIRLPNALSAYVQSNSARCRLCWATSFSAVLNMICGARPLVAQDPQTVRHIDAPKML